VTLDRREVISRFLDALRERDKDALARLIHSDFVTEIPQSGERNSGFEGFWAELQSYPGGGPITPPVNEVSVLGDEERWAMSPGYTIVPLASPNAFTVKFRILYPDGAWWHVVGLVELRDDKISRLENYFAPELPAPLAESIATWPRR
jgi:hypothetical protein